MIRSVAALRPAAVMTLWLPFFLLGSCTFNQYFAPRENRNGEGPSGAPAAVYPLAIPMQGEVRLWSDGAIHEVVDGKPVTYLHIGFELENTGAEPLRLIAAKLSLEVAADPMLPSMLPRFDLVPAISVGEQEAKPGRTARCQFQFDLGADRLPRTVPSCTVRFTAQQGEHVVSQVTPFRAFEPPRPVVFFGDSWPCWGASFCGVSGWR
ncbi:MAG: hypothetical protein NT107_01405 [Planctomycetota bacterium]|nr:hypothetical protein [Planctomycetota bacterium]